MGDFEKILIFGIGEGRLFPRDIENIKRRYAYLVLENVGNFQIGYKDSIVVLSIVVLTL